MTSAPSGQIMNHWRDVWDCIESVTFLERFWNFLPGNVPTDHCSDLAIKAFGWQNDFNSKKEAILRPLFTLHLKEFNLLGIHFRPPKAKVISKNWVSFIHLIFISRLIRERVIGDFCVENVNAKNIFLLSVKAFLGPEMGPWYSSLPNIRPGQNCRPLGVFDKNKLATWS